MAGAAARDAAFPPPLLVAFDMPLPGVAEDAPPLLWDRPAPGAIGVFDGMGGAGARVVSGEHGRHTSAWYAARIARAAVYAELGRWRDEGVPCEEAMAGRLSDAITEALGRANRSAPAGSFIIRSSLIRCYPTTAALLLFRASGAGIEALALWAGDSRCYVLTPADGLQQVSRDDSRTGADPMAALREDSPLNNMLSAEGAGVLNHARLPAISPPAVLLVATDGCFGSLPSPMHFERILLEALARAEEAAGPAAFRAGLLEQLAPVASDDISLAAAFLGWRSLTAAAAMFAPRLDELRRLLGPIDADMARVAYLEAAAAALRKQTQHRLAEGWAGYRSLYLAYAEAAAGSQ